jgi:protein phosphatase 4 regulatory subunit 3
VALLVASPNSSELSLQQHLDLAPDLLSYGGAPFQEAAETPMMAQQVPHQSTDKKRVKVYELRNNDWFDRGTGFCTATYLPVCPPCTFERHEHPARCRACARGFWHG